MRDRPIVVVVALILPTLLLQRQNAPDVALERIYREYQTATGRSDVNTLVRLDQQLRALHPYWSWEGRPATTEGYRPNYAEIGVLPLLFDPDLVGYSGKLLREAHAIDSRSRRSFTLYSTVFGPDGEIATAPPMPEAAKAYLSEFPNGPFALQAHWAFGTFQSDLFQVIQGAEAGDSATSKYNCYQDYITREPLSVQRAQAAAIEHYRALTRLRPEVHEFADSLAEARRGHFEGWHYCSD